MSFLNLDLKTLLDILRICLLINWIAFMGMLLRIRRERQESYNKLTTFLNNDFLPIVRERQAAYDLQVGNNNGPGPTPLTDALNESISS
jgi:hypothetical protein